MLWNHASGYRGTKIGLANIEQRGLLISIFRKKGKGEHTEIILNRSPFRYVAGFYRWGGALMVFYTRKLKEKRMFTRVMVLVLLGLLAAGCSGGKKENEVAGTSGGQGTVDAAQPLVFENKQYADISEVLGQLRAEVASLIAKRNQDKSIILNEHEYVTEMLNSAHRGAIFVNWVGVGGINGNEFTTKGNELTFHIGHMQTLQERMKVRLDAKPLYITGYIRHISYQGGQFRLNAEVVAASNAPFSGQNLEAVKQQALYAAGKNEVPCTLGKTTYKNMFDAVEAIIIMANSCGGDGEKFNRMLSEQFIGSVVTNAWGSWGFVNDNSKSPVVSYNYYNVFRVVFGQGTPKPLPGEQTGGNWQRRKSFNKIEGEYAYISGRITKVSGSPGQDGSVEFELEPVESFSATPFKGNAAAQPTVPEPARSAGAADSNPVSITASSNVPPSGRFTYAAANLQDGNPATAWCAHGAKGNWVEFTFAKPTHIRTLSVLPGYGGNQAAFARNNRVKSANITAEGRKLASASFTDKMETQMVNVNSEVKQLRITIEEVYPGKDNDVCISEVSFH